MFGGAPADVTPQNCLADLCSSCPLYTSGRGALASYCKGKDWQAHVLIPLAEAAALRRDLGLRRPCIDPKLRHPAICGVFIAALRGRGRRRRFFSSGDISNAVYAMQLPEGLCEYFSMPPARAGLAGVFALDGVAVRKSDWLLPELAVLPMGCSWAFYAGPRPQPRIRLGSRRPASGAAYVDDYLVAAWQRAKVRAVTGKVERGLASPGIVAHEQVDATRQACFVGLDLDGEVVVVHCVWVTLLNGCSLAIYDAVCALFVVFAEAEWRGEVAASDASSLGRGICRRCCAPGGVAEVGRADERWRCLFEDSARPRHPMLGSARAAAALRDPGRLPSEEAKDWGKSFGEVDPVLLAGGGWAVARSLPGRDAFDVYRAEGLAVSSALWRRHRVAGAFGKRVARLVDNASLAFGMGAGRGASAQQRSLVALQGAGTGVLAAPASAAAAARQCEALRGGLLVSLAYLEQRSIGEPARADCRRRAGAFIARCSELHLGWSDWRQLGAIVVTYFDFLYFQVYGGDDASRLLAGVLWRARTPPPWLAVAAMAGVLPGRGQIEQAIAMILGAACYLRPSECDLLPAMQVVARVAGAARGRCFAALMLRPAELGRLGKTGLWDFAIASDAAGAQAAGRVARVVLPAGAPGGCMRGAASALGLTDFPAPARGLRRGEASGDHLAKGRQALEMQQRGGWAADENYCRWAKQARIITELQRARARVVAIGQEVGAALPVISLGGAPAPAQSRTSLAP
ncbi:unnamed protein product [Prorocentrum cordatum]|uniref:Anaphase-promoting complex subunit 1 n=1 Tax=Prorocentrum cordatum TaxID=2364126 RepID=A0ABN9QUA9_9DINO|nr:unnamed protein product [Polarella glacialis]